MTSQGQKQTNEQLKSGIGDRIVQAQKHSGLSVKDFAEQAGFTYAMFSRYRSGKVDPRFTTLCHIGQITGVNFEWLMTGKGEMVGTKKEVDDHFSPVQRKLITDLVAKSTELISQREQQIGQSLSPEDRAEATKLLVNEALFNRKFLTENNPNVTDLLKQAVK